MVFHKLGESTSIPLLGIDAKVQIINYVARVELNEKFVNNEEAPLECVFEFPLPEKSCVCEFSATLSNGTTINGIVKEKQKAQEQYDDGIAAGLTSFLGSQEKKDLFTTNLGNLQPQETITVKIVYLAQLISQDLTTLKFVLPTTLLPTACFDPSQQQQQQQSNGDNKAARDIDNSAFSISFEFNVQMSNDIIDISSPSHQIAIVRQQQGGDNKSARVTVVERAMMNKDLELFIQTVEDNIDPSKFPQGAMIETITTDANSNSNNSASVEDKYRYALMLPIAPKFDAKEFLLLEPNAEVVFVADCSGSMSGSKMSELRRTMQIFIQSLPMGVYFNIVKFGSHFEKLFPESSRPYDESTLAVARAYLENMDANMGGTDIFSPLSAIFREEAIHGLTKQIFILTDGQVMNSRQVFAEIKSQCRASQNRIRLFSFGLGNDCDQALVTGMAVAGNGVAEFILSGEKNLDEKVLTQLNRALKPAYMDCKLDFGALPITLANPRIPPIYYGTRHVVYAFAPNIDIEALADSKIELTCIDNRRQVLTQTMQLKQLFATQGKIIHQLAAYERIQHLEQETADDAANKQEIIDLSTRFQISSMHTSFVCVNEAQETPITEPARLRVIEPIVPPAQSEQLYKHCLYPSAPSVPSSARLRSPQQQIQATTRSTMAANIDHVLMRSEQMRSLELKSAKSLKKSKSAGIGAGISNALSNAASSISSWFSLGGGASPAPHAPMAPPSQPPKPTIAPPAMPQAAVRTVDMAIGMEQQQQQQLEQLTTPIPAAAPAPAPAPVQPRKTAPDRGMDGLLFLQTAEGSWLLDEALAEVLGVAFERLLQHLPEAGREKEWATALALVALEVKYGDKRAVWEMISIKARRFLLAKKCDGYIDRAKSVI